jgi:hypothetical protein
MLGLAKGLRAKILHYFEDLLKVKAVRPFIIHDLGVKA